MNKMLNVLVVATCQLWCETSIGLRQTRLENLKEDEVAQDKNKNLKKRKGKEKKGKEKKTVNFHLDYSSIKSR